MNETAEQTDGQLLAAFLKQKDQDALTALVRRHAGMVRGVCRSILQQDQDAEDAAQAVFLTLVRKAGTLRQDRSAAPWLHHVALCVSINALKARAVRMKKESQAAEVAPVSAAEPAASPDVVLTLNRELDKLPDKYRRALVLFHLEERSLAETARVLERPIGTIGTRLARGRELLRKRLLRRGVTVSVTALAGLLSVNAAAADVPAAFVSATVKAAALFAAGKAVGGLLSVEAVVLAKGALKTMFYAKLKTIAAALAGIGLVGSVAAYDWTKVDQAISNGLPKTAIQELQPIIAQATRDKAYAAAIKAIATKIALEATVEGNKPEEKIVRLQREIAAAPAAMRPAMETILGHWYWHYFQQNRWRFSQRTQGGAAAGADLTTWDLPRILAEIDSHFSAALAGEAALKATPVAAYDELLEKGSLQDGYRPTLFDFLAYEALSFYTAGEQGGAQAEDAFVLSADSPIFGTPDEFLAWQPETTDATSPTLKAIRLYQALLSFHRRDADPSALADADLARLTFGRNKAEGETKSARYKAALERFAATWARHEIGARALAAWAAVLQEEGEPAKARELALRGLAPFTNSVGAGLCFNLIQQIEARSADVVTERVWNEPWPSIDVTYRNVTKVYLRAVPYDFAAHVQARRWNLFGFDESQQKELLGRRPDLEWSADLPPTADFRERTEKLPAPKTLKPGFYFIIASYAPSFAGPGNRISVAPVWVSDLALIMRPRSQAGMEGFVLKGRSGDPVAGAAVRQWPRNNEGRFAPGAETRTDSNGLFRFEGADNNSLFVVTAGDQQLATADSYHQYRGREGDPRQTRVVFFTDRALYRPGQTIAYKGICYRFNQTANTYAVEPGGSIRVQFLDPNSKEIASATHRGNDYGSFSGSFTAPRDRALGWMRIQADGSLGQTAFNVEEYKRPKFQVELAAPKEAAALNAAVTLTGKATAYTGAPIGGAKVSWRIVRQVRWPEWRRWFVWGHWPNRGASQAIAHGSAVTAADGAFAVTFIARPDPSVAPKDEPVFEYAVSADVTDSTGETRSSARTVRAAYTALQATLAAVDWQTPAAPVMIEIATRSLDGEPQAAEGTVKIHRLKQPAGVLRSALASPQPRWSRLRMGADPKPDPADPNGWELGEVVSSTEFKTAPTSGVCQFAAPLATGIYRAMLETKDRFGKPVTARLPIHVVDPQAPRLTTRIANSFTAPQGSVQPGATFIALWGTGYDQGRAFVEIERAGRLLRSYWTAADRTQEVIEQAVGEDLRGGFTVRATYVRENRAYLNEQIVDVPWSNKVLAVKWEHFTSKLAPGQKDTWTAVVTGPDAKGAVAEMVAALYDASLDQYRPHGWIKAFDVFRRETRQSSVRFENNALGFWHLMDHWAPTLRDVDLRYRAFPDEIAGNAWMYQFGANRGRGLGAGYGTGGFAPQFKGMSKPQRSSAAPAAAGMALRERAAVEVTADSREMEQQDSAVRRKADGDKRGGGPAPAEAAPDLSQVAARRNLNETAFFFPHLVSSTDGTVRMEFTMPEALTEWTFLGFAHDQELRAGFLTDKTVTAKDLMVEPNPPRFVREGDTIAFTVKVSNRTTERQSGKVRLTLADARTLKAMDAALGNTSTELAFDVPGMESRSYAWRLTVPDGCDFLTYKAVGATDRLSDGEEGYLPVLSRRILVTESLPLPIRGKQTKTFDFARLRASGKSDTLQQQSLTVQMVSQPAWYAVMALPYLMEYPYEGSEQVFSRLYANTLARHIANSDPKIRRVFDLWKGTPALDSPLTKNQDLKSVMLEETPWLRQANNESEARRNVGVLFDANRLNEETARNLRKLGEMQLSEGLWPWFPGGRPSEYISLYIVTGFGRLRHLGAATDVAPALKALNALDGWVDVQYRTALKVESEARSTVTNRNHLTSTIAFYLYGRSFFLNDRPIPKANQEAVDYWLGQARTNWLQLDCRQSQAHLAVGLHRFGDAVTPRAIMNSIKERSVSNEEMGLFWRDLELSWWWYRAPIETQAMMIEAFAEVMNDAQAVEDCKVWLLKQKQTQDWKTTKATADAVYALLLRGTNLLASDALVEVSLAGVPVKPGQVEAGTGFYEQRFTRGEIKPAMGAITVKKVDEGVSWGSVHWQYLEDMAKVTPYAGTPLKLKKALFVKEATKKGQELRPVTGPLQVGDELVVRLELRTDRDMEYVHLKDQRGSGTEPVSVFSQYRYQDGLAYYESTRDTASHFFIDYLPKGAYVFEYSTRIQHKGRYQTGVAAIQCLYAPEFNSHSESFTLDVR